MTSPITFESLYARYSETLADVLGEVDDLDPTTLTPDTFGDRLADARDCLARLGGSLADAAEDIDTALSYLADAEEDSDPAARAVLLGKAAKHLEGLEFASDELVC
ncbi:hypothetical protein [Streptacidiphilus rugosus]|uniref:hypothetical protein n=1 Tax=Streptacidiphilus rugosus TaxID=405783 RepID=UPI0005639495|nr:hypothetical protein [Streptacidiphilus rugosus]